MYKKKLKFLPVHEPDLDIKDSESVLKTLKRGEISGSATRQLYLPTRERTYPIPWIG